MIEGKISIDRPDSPSERMDVVEKHVTELHYLVEQNVIQVGDLITLVEKLAAKIAVLEAKQ